MKDTKKQKISNETLISENSFEKLRAKNRNKLIRRRISYGVVAVGLCAVFAVVCAAVFFRVEDIDVRGSVEYSDEEISKGSGIEAGMNMFTLNTGSIKKDLILNYPYIKSINISRRIPSTVVFDITEEEAKYYIDICGENFVVSQTLKVLEKAKTPEDLIKKEKKLIKLTLPEIRYAVVGRTVLFKTDAAYEYMKELVDEIKDNPLFEFITVLNCSNRYGIYVVYEGPHGRFKINLGGTERISSKLSFASEMLKSFGETDVGTVDVQTNPGFVILDDKLILE